MPHSIKAKLSGLHHKGYITDAEYDRLKNVIDKNVLDKIRAEIEDYITHSPYIKSFIDCCRLRDDVMRIIDKYRNEVD